MSGSLRFATYCPRPGRMTISPCTPAGATFAYTIPGVSVLLCSPDGPDDDIARKLLGKLGAEPLSEDFTSAAFVARMRELRAPIKQALLAGEVVVGVGNIYACEALFLAGIRPTTPARAWA